MRLENLRVGLGITGSFCNFDKIENLIKELKAEGVSTILPIVSNIVRNESTRFYAKEDLLKMLEESTGNKVIDSIVKAEPVGPKNLIDILLIFPCTGNTNAKLTEGITDTPVLMVAKSHVRNNKPVVIAISTNDGLGQNFKNIGSLINDKNYYFVPFRQDDHINKPKSLVYEYSYIIDTMVCAMQGKQLQPILAK
ncbi:MAG: dipicolinate synthase subunit B [Clostridia bacterium]|nr:dipicolinate synthase subunit B [Clostridia bacterium]